MGNAGIAALRDEIGQARVSDWVVVDQARIDGFADVTEDHQFIHIDPERAIQTPFGGTITHGFLILSLVPRMLELTPSPPVEGLKMAVNYGLDRVRFLSPVRSGSRVRCLSTLLSVEEKRPGQHQQSMEVAIEVDGAEKPAMVAVLLAQFFI